MKNLLAAFRSGLLAVLVAIVAFPALAIDGNEMFADPEREARARDIGRQLRCMVCQNQSIFDSNAGLAKDLRVLVRSRMEAGDTDSEVLTYIADRYGDYVLLKPRWSVKNAVLWLGPPLALVLGLAGAFIYLRGRRPAEERIQLSEADRNEARKILQGDGS